VEGRFGLEEGREEVAEGSKILPGGVITGSLTEWLWHRHLRGLKSVASSVDLAQ